MSRSPGFEQRERAVGWLPGQDSNLQHFG